jgi:hypothetical protein
MNHADIASLRRMRDSYNILHKTPMASTKQCWLANMYYYGDNLPIIGSQWVIKYKVSRWDRIKLVFMRPWLYLRYDLNREYVYDDNDINTICLRTITQEKMDYRSAIYHDIELLIYDNANKRVQQLKWATIEEIDRALGVSHDMTYKEYWEAIQSAYNKHMRIDVCGSKSRSQAIAWQIMRSIDDKIAHCQTVVKPLGITAAAF